MTGERCALALAAAGLTASALLARGGHEPISTCIRRSVPLRVAVTALWVHLVWTVPGDPLTWAADRLARQLT